MDKFTTIRGEDDGRTYLHNRDTGETELIENTEGLPYYPSFVERVLHLFGKHVWTYTKPFKCVYPGCGASKSLPESGEGA